MKTGICKLCNKDGELKKSHTIPRSVFKSSLKEHNFFRILDRSTNKVINTQDQWVAYMLCGDCEQLLSSKYEKYSLEILRGQSRCSKVQYKPDHLQILNVDQKRLINFVISILWRSLESSHENFNYLKSLGVSEDLKRYLAKCVYYNELPKPQAYTVRISKLTTTNHVFQNDKLNFITSISFSLVKEGFLRFLFIMEGYCFEVFLHAKKNIRVSGLGVLKRNKNILKMPYIEAFSIPELNKSLLDMLSANHK